MPELGQFLGALMVSVAHARRIADEEATAIAEYYKSHPLLEGMSHPRIRVREMVVEIPLLVETLEEGEANIPEDHETVVEELMKELDDAAKEEDVELNEQFVRRFRNVLSRQLRRVAIGTGGTIRSPREAVARSVELAFAKQVKRMQAENPRWIRPEQAKAISTELRNRAFEVALKRVGQPPAVMVSAVTAEVKDKATAANISRIRLTVTEEGLEWTSIEGADGARSHTLTPE